MLNTLNCCSFIKKINECSDLKELEDLRVSYLGKNGILTNILKELSKASIEEKRTKGKELNKLKEELQTAFQERRDYFASMTKQEKLRTEAIDVTLPPLSMPYGRLHPITGVIDEIVTYFAGHGFTVYDGPEIDDEFHNFDALNVPSLHPARQMQDTFYLNSSSLLLRTHTSNAQIHALKGAILPIRMLSQGRVYRNDALDSTHTPMFHQVEGLMVDENVNMGHLKWLLFDFCAYFFEKKDVKIRFRPSFFPFTEPSVEVDIAYKKVKDRLVFGEGDHWMEVLGAGMTHPNVLEATGHSSAHYQGFAFGMGVERLLMLKYGITDIRRLYENDVRFLSHYGKKV